MAMDRHVNKKIGIMGGTFDPIHNVHLIIAERAREEFDLDKILFIPSGTPPHKKEVFASAPERLEMVRIAIAGNRYFDASDMEVKREGITYTYDTVSLIKKQNPHQKIFFITGEDEFYNLSSWYRYKGLVRKTVFLVAPREQKLSCKVQKIPFLTYRFIDMPLLGISSSYIRDCLLTGKTVKYLVPEKVIAYIKRYNLYEKKDVSNG
jgi:nicotinate-nucleotide adenylyltransferase